MPLSPMILYIMDDSMQHANKFLYISYFKGTKSMEWKLEFKKKVESFLTHNFWTRGFFNIPADFDMQKEAKYTPSSIQKCFAV